ncbi:MAG: RHS repeat-associated core domain-containing protein, partial [Desulfatiglandaceae bacterium]
FWTDPFTVPEAASLTKIIPHQDVTITVNGDFNGDVLPFPNLKTYLFTPSGSYLNKSGTTDGGGSVTFTLPEQEYKVRADYLNVHYWSGLFNGQDTTIKIPEGMAHVQISQGPSPLPNVNVYVFSSSNAYLGLNGKTGAQGIVSFRLPAGTYNFRADYQGSHFWATASVEADLTNEIDLDTGGGSVGLTLEKAQGEPLTNIPVYVFTENGTYLGISAHTDGRGLVSFDLSDGWYKFRADYLGYHFWSESFEVPQSLSRVLTILHQDVTVTVNKVYGNNATPLENTRVYLFTENGAYQNVHADTDAQGKVIFNVPQKSYKVRADYLNSQYWSDVFEWQDKEINIEHGDVRLHVTENGSNPEDVPVYLFTDQGAYLGQSVRTDAFGDAVFTIPAKAYKFRVDYNGTQYWTDVINVIPSEETDVSLALDQLALNLTNDPSPIRFDGKPPVFRPNKIRVASIGSLAGILLQSIVAQIPEEKVYYFINDHLGTPQKVVDENGQVVWSADYQPFGEASLSTTTVTNNFRFPGQYYDAETALHYNYHRYYDPGAGRYLTPDPLDFSQIQILRQSPLNRRMQMPPNLFFFNNIQLVISTNILYSYTLMSPQNLGLYLYGRNNPMKWVDPIGLFSRGDILNWTGSV